MVQHRIRIPNASTPYQRRPGDFFTLSQSGWEYPGKIGSHDTCLKKEQECTDVCGRILLYNKRTKASKKAMGCTGITQSVQ
jgi:hypothetical protein